jgi:hypothetical protein
MIRHIAYIISGYQRYILSALAQRRQVNGKGLEAKIEIAAKFALVYHLD